MLMRYHPARPMAGTPSGLPRLRVGGRVLARLCRHQRGPPEDDLASSAQTCRQHRECRQPTRGCPTNVVLNSHIYVALAQLILLVRSEPPPLPGRFTRGCGRPARRKCPDGVARRGLTAADSDVLLFVSKGAAPLNYSHWRQRVWEPACVRAGHSGLTFHDLRRANATGMVADKVDLKTAQIRLGHSGPLWATLTRA